MNIKKHNFFMFKHNLSEFQEEKITRGGPRTLSQVRSKTKKHY